MKFNIKELEKYEKDGWIYSHYHKDLDLVIWNYSNHTQYESYWNDITLNCRGLVTDLEGNVISKGFSKFFNYSEGKTNIPEIIESITVYEKIDGSYIGLFYYEDQWIINSKGSFYSEQVNWAKELLTSYNFYGFLNKELTYCFELVYPENRIVCDYGERKELVFLACFNRNGNEINSDHFTHSCDIGVPVKIELSLFEPERLKALNSENSEGYVIKFSNGERCKIKFDEYMRLHRIVTNTTSYDIWDHLRQEKPFDEILDRVPDEFMKFVTDTKEDLENKYNRKLKEIEEEFWQIVDKKYYAYRAKQSKNKSYLFTRLNSYSDNLKQAIWREIKPSFQKPFTNEH